MNMKLRQDLIVFYLLITPVLAIINRILIVNCCMEIRDESSLDYTIESVDEGILVEFHTTDAYLEKSYFPFADESTVLIERNTGDKYITAIEHAGFTVQFKSYF